MRNEPPPLSKVDLHTIQERNRTSLDVMTLLREIKRLRATILYADHFERTIGPSGGSVDMVRQTLRERLNTEPCVQEFPRLSPDS